MSEFTNQILSRRNFVGRMAAAAGIFAPRLLSSITAMTLSDRLNFAMRGANETEILESRPGHKSLTFSGIVGTTYPPPQFSKRDYLIDQSQFNSEGNWAFCRFASEEIPAVRMGFQRGGFNITATDKVPDKSRLQLHLEIMTKDGALLWLPSGRYPARQVITNPERMEIQLEVEKREIFSIRGWPDMEWHFRSDDGEAEVNLHVTLNNVTLLPDCILPQCIFSMWEAVGDAHGTIRYQNRIVSVDGKVFYDHPRIIQQASHAIPRNMYLYTTMYFEDGSSIFGYHAEDEKKNSINYYCFGVYVDASGKVRFLRDTEQTRLDIGQDNIPKHWQMRWRKKELVIEAEIEVRHPHLLRSWGSPSVPGSRTNFPLVLDGHAKITRNGRERNILGRGLAEYYNAQV